MKTEMVRFRGALGGQLAGRLDRPDGPPRAYALFAHCFTCGKDLKATARISRELCGQGLAVLRFDFTGLGESEGEFADSNFSSNVDDLLAASEFLGTDHEPPRLLVGHSLGGAAVLVAAQRLPQVRAVATIGAPADTQHLAVRLEHSLPDLDSRGEAEMVLAGRRLRVRKQLIEDLSGKNLDACLAELNRPLIVFHSPVDSIVSIDHARRIYQTARHPKSFVSLDQADHLLTDTRDATFVARILGAWADHYTS